MFIEFPRAYRCDCASNSESLSFCTGKRKQLGVLDIDSPLFSRFSEEDEAFLTEAAEIISRAVAQKL
jgi:GAF domain-containing protein